jgi:hypothetical protein
MELGSVIGGASVTAAHLINNDSSKYVVNWFGGWHHAKRYARDLDEFRTELYFCKISKEIVRAGFAILMISICAS